MTLQLQPPDAGHLQAAEGWVGLGDYAAANDELEQITAACRAEPSTPINAHSPSATTRPAS